MKKIVPGRLFGTLECPFLCVSPNLTRGAWPLPPSLTWSPDLPVSSPPGHTNYRGFHILAPIFPTVNHLPLICVQNPLVMIYLATGSIYIGSNPRTLLLLSGLTNNLICNLHIGGRFITLSIVSGETCQAINNQWMWSPVPQSNHTIYTNIPIKAQVFTNKLYLNQ